MGEALPWMAFSHFQIHGSPLICPFKPWYEIRSHQLSSMSVNVLMSARERLLQSVREAAHWKTTVSTLLCDADRFAVLHRPPGRNGTNAFLLIIQFCVTSWFMSMHSLSLYLSFTGRIWSHTRWEAKKLWQYSDHKISHFTGIFLYIHADHCILPFLCI